MSQRPLTQSTGLLETPDNRSEEVQKFQKLINAIHEYRLAAGHLLQNTEPTPMPCPNHIAMEVPTQPAVLPLTRVEKTLQLLPRLRSSSALAVLQSV